MPKPALGYMLFWIFCGLLLSYSLSSAQTTSADYRIRAGDLLNIYVDGYPEYTRDLPVLPSGTLSYPRVGDVQAEGATPSELSKLISQRLKTLNSPTVYVAVLEPQKNMIYVQGMVKSPGGQPFESDTVYLLEALALAGGLDHDRADMSRVRIFRHGKLETTTDISGLLNGNTDVDIELQPQDLLVVPSRLQQRTIAVTGSVMEPDSFVLEEDQIHVLRALWMAGGPLQDVSDLANAVVIYPNGRVTRVDLDELSKNPALQSDQYMMSPGDVLYIPNAYVDEKVSVIGEVRSPGQYAVKGPIDVIEALSLAGGFLQDQANLKKAFIQRADGTREPVNLTDFFEEDAGTAGVSLNPGDTLSVPKRMKINWNALYTVVLTASLIYNIATR